MFRTFKIIDFNSVIKAILMNVTILKSYFLYRYSRTKMDKIKFKINGKQYTGRKNIFTMIRVINTKFVF